MKNRLLLGFVLVLLSFSIPSSLNKPSEDGVIHLVPALTIDNIEAKSFETQSVLPLVTVEQPKVVSGTITNCGDNIYKQYIYQHESGCRTTAVNWIGCTGIGQACPASKIAHCGSDFACQDAWFSNYAVTRYGSWEGAYNFWLSHKWW